MTRTITSTEIAGGYALAGFILCVGVYVGVKSGSEEAWSLFIRGFYFLAALIVAKSTFMWGRRRGFPARKEDGRILVANVIRNLVMTAIVWAVLMLIIGPLAMLSFRLARG